MTEKLYESQPGCTRCRAQVLSCERAEEGWQVELDATVLFPGGGGQLCDRGWIDGAAVSAVYEREGQIFHLCERGFPAGSGVEVELDDAVRLAHSQQHTGEHILSHAFWKLFGAKNVGFHSDEHLITIDLDRELSREECARAEEYANGQIWDDRKVNILYRDREHLDDLEVRKVTDKVEGVLRIVAIDGGDVCTCCGTHVERTGSVGMVKIVSIQRHRGGTRLEAVCGREALRDYQSKTELLYDLSCALSCGGESMADRIAQMKADSRELSTRLGRANARLMDYAASEALAGCGEKDGKRCVMVPLEGSVKEAKQLLTRLTGENAILAGVFYADGGRVGYMIARTAGIHLSCREAAAVANALLNGKGGGSDTFAQGSGKYSADWRELVAMAEQSLLRML